MLDNEINVNEEKSEMIHLDQDDPIYKYQNIPLALIRDQSISPNCRWLIIYLLSNKPGWKIKSTQLYNHTKGFIGRDKIINILKEAIEAGYIKKNCYKEGNLIRFNYTVSSTPKFKKCFPRPENQGPEIPVPEKQGRKEILYEEELSKENITPPPPSRGDSANASSVGEKKPKKEISQEAKDLYPLFLKTILDFDPDFVPPKNSVPLLEAIDKMLKEDKRRPGEILRVLEWGINDNIIRGDWNGWSSKILGAKNPANYLRDKFHGISTASKAKKDRKFSPSSNDETALETMKKMSERAL